MGYLFPRAGQMLALTPADGSRGCGRRLPCLLVSAAIGRDLRRETFPALSAFSNAEIENFSTASSSPAPPTISSRQFVQAILLRMQALCAHSGHWRRKVACCRQQQRPFLDRGADVALLLLLIFLMSVAMPKIQGAMQQLVDRLNLVSREILTGIMPVRAFQPRKFEEQR